MHLSDVWQERLYLDMQPKPLNDHNELPNHLLSHRISIVLALHWNYLSHKVNIPPKPSQSLAACSMSKFIYRCALYLSVRGHNELITMPFNFFCRWIALECFNMFLHRDRTLSFAKKESNIENNTTSQFQIVTGLSIIWHSLDTKVCFSLDGWW